MRLSAPRTTLLANDELDDEQRVVVAGFRGRVLSTFRTMERAPKALRRFNVWGGYVLSDRKALAPHARELLILRAGWLCRSDYEWVQHTRIGLHRAARMADA